ncbi:type IV secretory system conjugative DNA transfer family protein [Burkholderia ubonensis]|uniref:type IV secretory system conjugative DNA transfer family protein n=1 Tax=Burkholderia ubonensis TaxID=101571 RepID=UPI0012F8F05B|nr:hypothetical protein [Burkholderia ubonensis]
MGTFPFFEALFGRKADVRADGVLMLGRNMANGHEISLDDSTQRSHIFISGRSGAGVSILLEQLLTQQTTQGRGWVYMDPAGDTELLNRLAATARHEGRDDEFYVLDLDKPENGNTYDILRSGTPEERAVRALHALPYYENNPGADQYASQAFDFLVPLLGAIDATGKSVGLRDLGVLLMQLDNASAQRELLDAIPTGHPARAAFLAAIDPFRGGDEAEGQRLKNVLGGLAGRLYALAAGFYADVLCNPRPEIVLSDILAHNKMLYIRLPLMGKDITMRSLARMLLHDVITSMQARAHTPKRLRTPFLCVMNAFPVYGFPGGFRHPMTNSAYSQARGMKVSMVPVNQGDAWGRLREFHEDGADALMGNTFTKVYFRQKQDELTNELHPDLPESTLDGLTLGEFVMWQGATRYRGLVSNNGAPEQATAITRHRMWPAEERVRLNLTSTPDPLA